MFSSRLENVGVYCPFWYLTMCPGSRFPVEPSLMGAEGYDRVSESGSEVGSLVGFYLGVPGSEVGSAEGGSLGAS